MANEQVIIEFNIEANEALQATVALTDKLKQLKQQKKELEKALKEDGGNKALKEQLAQTNAQIGATSSSLKGYQKELTNVVKAGEAETNSLQQQRAVLSNLTAQWDRLSAAEREGAKGTEIANQIKATTDNLMQLEGSTGRFQRNVGNYKSALDGAGAALKGLGSGAGGAIGAIQGLGNAFKALIANPVGAAIAAIAVVVKQLANAFKENDDAGTNLSRAFTVFQPILDAVKNAFSLLADVLGKVALGVSKVYRFFYDMLIPSYKDAAKAAEDLVIAEDRLQDKQREATVENAKNNKKIAENNAKVADREKYTAKERIKLLQENAKLEKQNLERTKANAAEEYRIAKAQADRKRKLSDEDKDRLAELQKAMIDAETDYQNSLVSINKKTSAAIKEINKEREAAEKAAAEKRQKAAEAYKKVQEDRLEVEQELFKLTASAFELQRAEAEKYYDDLLKKAHNNKQLIEQIEAQKAVAIAKIYQALLDEETAAANKKMAESLANARNLYDKFFKESQTWDKVAELTDANAETAALMEAKSNSERLAIAQSFAKQRLYIAQMMYDNMQQMEGESAADFTLRQQQQLKQLNEYKQQYSNITSQIGDENKKLISQQIDIVKSFSDATMTMADAIVDALSQSADDEEKYQKWKLIMSIIEAQIQGGLAIMSAIATATPGDPYSVAARIASAAAAAGAATIAAVAQLTSLKGGIPNAPRFAQGGYVSGKGTSTSDSIAAWLSNGESVMTAKATQMFAPMLSAMNVAGGGAPITQAAQNNAMRNMWEEAFKDMPNPVVSVKEITNVSSKVKIKENIAKSR